MYRMKNTQARHIHYKQEKEQQSTLTTGHKEGKIKIISTNLKIPR